MLLINLLASSIVLLVRVNLLLARSWLFNVVVIHRTVVSVSLESLLGVSTPLLAVCRWGSFNTTSGEHWISRIFRGLICCGWSLLILCQTLGSMIRSSSLFRGVSSFLAIVLDHYILLLNVYLLGISVQKDSLGVGLHISLLFRGSIGRWTAKRRGCAEHVLLVWDGDSTSATTGSLRWNLVHHL